MTSTEKEKERRELAEKDAKEKLSLLNVDQVARAAAAFREKTGSAASPRSRFYIRAGRCAWMAIYWGMLPKDIAVFLMDKTIKNG